MNTERSGITTKERPGKVEPSWKQWLRQILSKEWMLVLFTGVLSALAVMQYFVMDGQLDVMRKEQRAWMAVEDKPENLEINVAPSSQITVINTGKTPALQIVGSFYVEVVPNGKQPRFEAQEG